MQRTFLLIGGTTGIGRATLDALLSSGHRVHLASRSAGRFESASEGRLLTQDFDALEDDLESLDVPAALDGFAFFPGSITLKPFTRLTEADFLEDYRRNLLAPVRILQSVLPALKRSTAPDGASVVLFSSVAATTGLGFHASIASAKAAVEGLIRSLAAEWAPAIRVNGIAPSLTETPMSEFLLNSPEKRAAGAMRHPLQTIGRPEDIASLATWLLGDTSRFCSGQVFNVDGGLNRVRVF